MARKDLLKDLIANASAPKDAAPEPNPETQPETRPETPRSNRGAIGAVSRSIAELRARSVVELPADLIDPGGLDDRLSDDPEADLSLRASLKEYGQQVPVLVRHDPNREGRYQIIYGRRRVAALKRLGLPVRAMIHDLDDKTLVIAQGQENTARRDLSFIEKANFGRQMEELGFSRKELCDVLSVDKTVISRMLKVAGAVPLALIRAIGSAPGTGRDRWQKLATRLEDKPLSAADLKTLIKSLDKPDSDARFEMVFRKLTAVNTAPPAPKPTALRGTSGAKLGTAKRGPKGRIISFDNAGGFDDWLIDNIEELHRDWMSRNEG